MIRALLEVNPTMIYEELVTVYGNSTVSYSKLQRWSKKVNDGKMELEDNSRSGRPVSETTENSFELIQSLIEEDPHLTYDDLEAETMLSCGTLFTIIPYRLKLKNVTSRWVPHPSTDPSPKARKSQSLQRKFG